MKANYPPKCDACHKKKAMFGFVTKDNITFNLCGECIASVGEMTDDKRKEFFERLQGNETGVN